MCVCVCVCVRACVRVCAGGWRVGVHACMSVKWMCIKFEQNEQSRNTSLYLGTDGVDVMRL